MSNRCGECRELIGDLYTMNDRVERVHWGCVTDGEGVIFKVRRGSITFESDGPISLEGVKNLIESAKLMGVPPEAKVTSISYRYYSETCEIDLSYQVDGN